MYLKFCVDCLKNKKLSSALHSAYRNYHSEKVFGFKRKIKQKYSIPEDVQQNRNNESNFYRLVTAYRQHAHKAADVNPVALSKSISNNPELQPDRYGLKGTDKVKYAGIVNMDKTAGTVTEAVEFLKAVYGSTLSAEFMHLEEEEEIEWFSNRIEQMSQENIDKETQVRIAKEMLRSQAFDNFLATKFATVKRYGGEGAESMMAFFSEFFRLSSNDAIEQIVLCMPHRGRLNLLTGLLDFPPAKMFAKLKGRPDFPTTYQASGDVLSHCISSVDLQIEPKPLHVSLLYNPSHLEAINPVSMGKTRAKQLATKKDGDYSDAPARWSDKILNLQVHGDAAFAGQGVNQECLELSRAPHFEVGGSVHLIVNNQVGFTTPADRGRSSRYCTDLAKIISAPVIHVNGDYPEMVVKATRLAFEYQRKFRKEVFIDMNCFRRWGHNELDDPTFTNPSLYSIIHARGTVPDRYAEKLIKENVIAKEDIETVVKDHTGWLQEQLNNAETYEPEVPCFTKQWGEFSQAQEVISDWDTGVNVDVLFHVGNKSVAFPKTFSIHPHLLKTHVTRRIDKLKEGTSLDWSTAEALAIGSLLYDGYNVRISGQDVGRGTFSHRHAMLVDQQTNNIHVPLNNIDPQQKGFLEVANSILSEEAVLGYEYGMSIDHPNNLVIWEAQFGDFFNGAQIIFDTFVTSGETKWLWSSGLVVMLPHGYDGAGPEHSSARIERFLQQTDSKENTPDGDNVNMQVCQPSTPAQYFHLLRRQMVRNFRKPLIIITPKTLLRAPAATSSLSDMATGTSFQPVIGETMLDPLGVKKVLLTSGKHYYTLLEKRQSLGLKDTAIVRLESFCPFPTLQLREEVDKYKNARMFIWCQEEPRNMGAWTFVRPRFENLIGRRIRYCGRETMAAPAVGVGKWHQEQATTITTKPFLIDTEFK